MNTFTLGEVVIAFPNAPQRSGSEDGVTLHQAVGKDDLGNDYVYDKGILVDETFRLAFPNCTDDLFAALLVFLQTNVQGTALPFTWVDHLGVSRSVKFLEPFIGKTPTGPNRNTVSLTLIKQSDWAYLPAPASFTAAKNAKTGTAPVWILWLVINGVDYFLSDNVFTIASTAVVSDWPSGQAVTTLAWVEQWGRVDSVGQGLTGIKISDFSVTLLNDPAADPGIVELVETYPVEESDAKLFLWFHGLDPATDPPQVKFVGTVRDADPDDDRVSMVIQDGTLKMERNFVGWRATRLIFPGIDPDDVGRVVPIPYGTVKKGLTLAVDAGIITTIPAALSSSATTITLSEAGDLVLGDVITIDEERILLGTKSGNSFTGSTRGYDSTVAASHQKGATAWQYQAETVYLASDVPLDGMPAVYGRVGDKDMDITAVSCRYLGSGTVATVALGAVGGQHPDYLGRAVVTVVGYITLQQAIDLLVNDGISIEEALSLTETIGVTDGISIAETIGLSDPGHNHQPAGEVYQANNGLNLDSGNYVYASPAVSINAQTVNDYYEALVNCSSVSGTRQSVQLQFRIVGHRTGGTVYNFTIGTGAGGVLIEDWTPGGDGVTLYEGSSWDFDITIPISAGATKLNADSYTLLAAANNGSPPIFTVEYFRRIVTLSDITTVDPVAFTDMSKTGTVSKSGTVTKTGTVSLGGTVSKSGTVSLTGNSLANTLICDTLLVDKVRSSCTDPDDVFTHLLSYLPSPPTLTLEGSFPASYKFDGEINEYKAVLTWCDIFAFQCRAWFRPVQGIARLIVRPDTLTPIKTIPACRMLDGARTLTSRKSDYSDICNKIEMLYDRDWTKSGDEAYNKSIKDQDNTSIGIYDGIYERPELFRMDFIRDDDMAADVLAYWLGNLKDRHWRRSFEAFLDHSELIFGNIVTLGFKGNEVGIIISAGISPGSTKAIDAMKFTVEV